MEIEEIAKTIEQAGGRLFLVGGAIRDKLLGFQVHDEDYCVTGIEAEIFEQLFPQAYKRGKSFGVYDLENREFAMARKERKVGVGHKEFAIETNANISIEEDLERRDITINAMAEDVLTKEMVDPFGGRRDIEEKRIRAVSNAFLEDPLRVYRVARFAAVLGFDVEENTIAQMRALKGELSTLSAERVFTEFKKALASNHPSIFFQVLRQADVLEVHFKEIYDLIGSLQPEKYHPEGDSYNHTMQVVDKSVELTKDLEIRFSCLVHDLGKGITPKAMQPHHYGHDEKGVVLVENLGKRLRIPNDWISCGKVSAKEHMRGGIFGKMTAKKQVDFITRVAKSKLGLSGMKIVVMCDKARNGAFPTDVTFDKLGEQCLQEITGEKIKQKYQITEGKEVAEFLRKDRIKWIQENEKEFRKNIEKA